MIETDELLNMAVSSYKPSGKLKKQIMNRITSKKSSVELVFVSSDLGKIFDKVFSKKYGFTE